MEIIKWISLSAVCPDDRFVLLWLRKETLFQISELFVDLSFSLNDPFIYAASPFILLLPALWFLLLFLSLWLLIIKMLLFIHIYYFFNVAFWSQFPEYTSPQPNPLQCLLLIIVGALHLVFINSVMRLSWALSLMSSGSMRPVWCLKLKTELTRILLPPWAHNTSEPV